MKKSILAILTLSLIGVTQASYILNIPMEESRGGALPEGSISIKPRMPAENWQPASPLLGEWINNGAIYGCTNWTPSVSSMLKDVTFNQSATDCKQDQTSTIQDREQETTTLAYRNVGSPVSTTKTITASSTRTATGTGTGTIIIDFTTSASNTILPSSQITSFAQTTRGWVSSNHADSSEGQVTFQAITLQAGTVLTFNYQISTEDNFDFFKIYVGDALILSKSGGSSSGISYTVPTTGPTVIKFSYTKDGNVSAGTDTAAVTSLKIVPS